MGHSTRRSTTMASDSGPEYDNSLARVINILVAIMNILVCCLIGAYAVIERIIPADDAQTVAVGVFVTLFALVYISSEIVRPRLFYVYFGAVRDYFGAGALQIFLALAVADVEEDFGLVTALWVLCGALSAGSSSSCPSPATRPSSRPQPRTTLSTAASLSSASLPPQSSSAPQRRLTRLPPRRTHPRRDPRRTPRPPRRTPRPPRRTPRPPRRQSPHPPLLLSLMPTLRLRIH